MGPKMINSLFLFSLLALSNNGENIPRVGEEGVEAPVFTKRVSPDLPPELQKEKVKITGYVILEFVCRKNGEITDIKILRSIWRDKKLALEFIKALKKWEFMPGKKDGVPCDVRMTVKSEISLL